jgi:two-component system, NarL family, nitrate/nitrite response regulator NarL
MNARMKKLRILIIEDNRVLRDGLSAIVEKQPDLILVAAGGEGRDGLRYVRTHECDVILVDLGLKSENALRLVNVLAREASPGKIVGMGLVPSQEDVIEFVKAGAAGFILKSAPLDEVLRDIRRISEGKRILPPQFLDSLFTHVVDHAVHAGSARIAGGVRMTKREREIIVLIADALSNKDIAQRLHLSTYTVKSHIHNILEKLALHSRLQISEYSRQPGFKPKG